MRELPGRPKIIYIPRWGIGYAGKKPDHGGGVEKAQPKIDNGLNIDAVTTARESLAKMLESK